MNSWKFSSARRTHNLFPRNANISFNLFQQLGLPFYLWVKNNEIYINIHSEEVKNLFREKDQIFVKRRRFFFQKG
jgi:hypothetical protein